MKRWEKYALGGGAILLATMLWLRAQARSFNGTSFGVNADWGGPLADWQSHITENLLMTPSQLAQYGLNGFMRIEAFLSSSARYWYQEQIFAKFPSNPWVVILGDVGLSDAFGTSWSLSDWDNYVTQVISSHKFVHNWEIWNEVTNQNRWTGYLASNGLIGYAAMLDHAYQIIKKQNPLDTVIAFGGLFPFSTTDHAVESYNTKNWAALGAYSAASTVKGATNSFDAWSVHIYTDADPNATTFSYLPSQNFSSYPSNIPCNLTVEQAMTGCVQAIQSGPMAGKRLWVSEFGMPASIGSNTFYTQQVQYQFAHECIPVIQAWNADNAIWWTMINSAWGLWDPRVSPPSPRLALQAF